MLITRLTMPVCRPASVAVLVVAVLLLTASNSWSLPFLIDQANDADPPFQGYTGNSQTGQSFIPTLTGLNVVELQINDQSPGDGFGISMFVRVHDGANFFDPILGSSQVVSMPDFAPAPFIFPQLAHFDFAGIVPLTPGNTYLIEVVNSSFPGDIGVFAAPGFNANPYPSGEAYFLGQPASISDPVNSPVDLWFREGLAVAEPTTVLMLGAGLAGLFVRRRRR